METSMAKRQGPATESQEADATLTTYFCGGQYSPYITSDDDKGHENEQAELLTTSANASEHQLHTKLDIHCDSDAEYIVSL